MTNNAVNGQTNGAAVLAGALIGVALVGSIVWDPLWMALIPAAALAAVALLRLRQSAPNNRLSEPGALVLQAGILGLLALALVGAVAEARLGLSPRWIGTPTIIFGVMVTAGAALFGLSLSVAMRPRWPGVLFALSFPLGLGLDATTRALPQGELLFFAGVGAYVGLALFGIALVGLGLVGRRGASDGETLDG